jgi:hypothetical protein
VTIARHHLSLSILPREVQIANPTSAAAGSRHHPVMVRKKKKKKRKKKRSVLLLLLRFSWFGQEGESVTTHNTPPSPLFPSF